MADATLPKMIPREILVDVRPTPAAITSPAPYANVMRVVPDQNGFTLYFFGVPSGDIEFHPEASELFKKAAEQEGTDPLRVPFTMEPIAKIFLPPGAVMGVLEVLGRTFSAWQAAQGGVDVPTSQH